MSKKPSFFAKHAKSSAFMVTLIVHALIILVAASFVAYKVIKKEEKVFIAKENKRPRMKLKKLQVPIKIEKRRKTSAKLRKRVVAKKPKLTATDIQMPEITGVLGGLGAMKGGEGLGAEVGFTMPEINFFGVKKRSEKVVFIVLAGGASTKGSDDYSSPKSRMCFHTLRNRLNEMVMALPEYALFNVAFYQMDMTTPFSTKMLLATESNKQMMLDWGSTVNPLHLELTYGPEMIYEGFWERFEQLDWYAGDVMTNNVPPIYPKWVYRYNPGSHILKHFIPGTRDERTFLHWNRAACFALEQKPDTIFILTTNYIGEDEQPMIQMLTNICKDIYGKDSRKFPTINTVVLTRSGNIQAADNTVNKFLPIANAFRGKVEMIADIRDHMTREELEELEELDGVF